MMFSVSHCDIAGSGTENVEYHEQHFPAYEYPLSYDADPNNTQLYRCHSEAKTSASYPCIIEPSLPNQFFKTEYFSPLPNDCHIKRLNVAFVYLITTEVTLLLEPLAVHNFNFRSNHSPMQAWTHMVLLRLSARIDHLTFSKFRHSRGSNRFFSRSAEHLNEVELLGLLVHYAASWIWVLSFLVNDFK